MEIFKTIPPEVAALIPSFQLDLMKSKLPDYSETILRLKKQLEQCPYIGETINMEEHPAVFSYLWGFTQIHICEYDREDTVFGYALCEENIYRSGWRYYELSVLTQNPLYALNIHPHDLTIEGKLYINCPQFFKRPPSLEG